MLMPVWGSVSSPDAAARSPRDEAHEFQSLRRREMLAAAERSLAAAADVVHADAEAALDDILAARALIAAVLTVWSDTP